VRRPAEKEVNRIEAFSDGVFAIAATLLVVSLEVPKSFSALLDNLSGFAAFGLSFVILTMIWVEHNRFFRRFGLQDDVTVALNSWLLFVVLFFVYPLKFLSLGMINWAFGIGPQVIGDASELSRLFMLYGAGFVAVSLSFAALYHHALRQTHEPFDAADRLEARLSMQNSLWSAGIGLLCMLLAWRGIGLSYGAPGWVFSLLGVTGYWHGRRADKKRRSMIGSKRTSTRNDR
jgi:uncharacterized membrane protein